MGEMNRPSDAVVDALEEALVTLFESMPADNTGVCSRSAAVETIDRLRARGFDVQPMMGGEDA